MLARVAACALLFAACSFASADDAEVKKVAKTQAQESQDALLKGDYAKLVARMHPNAIKEGGGPKRMAELAANAVREWKDKGFAFKSVLLNDPSDPVKVGNELYIVVPFTMEMTVPGGRAIGNGALVGVSTDGGKEWNFTDAAPGRDALKKFIPDLPDALVIPKKEAPKFVKD